MTVEELETLVEAAESELRDLQQRLRDAKIEASPFRPDQIITDRKGEEAKILRLLVNYSAVTPIVVYRKKNGKWGEREYTLYSWDLPERTA